MREKRSSKERTAQGGEQLDLFGQGVGGRQTAPLVAPGGGGYPENCTSSNFGPEAPQKKRDPRFDELQRIGLPSAWLRVAERVGFDVWLDLWRMLSEDESVRHDGGARLPKLRCYTAYLRYQRNRYIEALGAQGVPPKEIQAALRRNLSEHLDITNIQRIAKRTKIAA